MGLGERTNRFNTLVWPHAAAVLRVANLLVHDGPAADDLVQETLLKAFRSLDGLRDESKVRPWLMSILRHSHTDWMRCRCAHAMSLERIGFEVVAKSKSGILDPGSYPSPDALMDRFGDREIITALREAPKDIRWTLLLVDVEGLQEDEASEALSVPVGTIKSRLFRGRRMLRESLLPAARQFHLAV